MGIPLYPKIVAPWGVKHSQMVWSGDKSQTSLLLMVVFDHQRLRPEWAEGEVLGTVYGLSKSWWIDAELFELWFSKHCLCTTNSPLLLLLDGHSSHYQSVCIDAAAFNWKYIPFCHKTLLVWSTVQSTYMDNMPCPSFSTWPGIYLGPMQLCQLCNTPQISPVFEWGWRSIEGGICFKQYGT